MSAGLVVTITGMQAVDALVSRLSAFDEAELLTEIGALGESQTRRRIEEEKTSPDGAAWPPNRAGTSTLLQTGRHLRDSIAYDVGASEVSWGASWEFAHVHQDGMTITPKTGLGLVFRGPDGRTIVAKKVTIPARPFVGISAANATDIDEQVTDFLRRLVP